MGVSQKSCVVVTGAAQGIGRQLVRSLVGAGYDVVLADLNAEKGEAVANEPCDGSGTRIFVSCDVSNADDCANLAKRVSDRFESVAGLVNNASIFSTLSMRPFWEIPESEWDSVIDVNLKGVWLVSRALLPLLRKSGRGSIVNISSGTVHLGRANYAHYVASKAGVIGLTRAMARELGDIGVRANAITPGPIFTEVPRASVTPEQKPAVIATQALKREGVPSDICSAIRFLLSEDSSFITGQTINVDGGMVMV